MDVQECPPKSLAALINRGWAIVGSAGRGPDRLATLEVRGSRTGRIISFPVMVADYQDERYLVAMLGEGAKWVSDVRAAGGQATLQRGRREVVHLEEVEPRARAPILRRYLEIAPGARPHIRVDRRAPGQTSSGSLGDTPCSASAQIHFNQTSALPARGCNGASHRWPPELASIGGHPSPRRGLNVLAPADLAALARASRRARSPVRLLVRLRVWPSAQS